MLTVCHKFNLLFFFWCWISSKDISRCILFSVWLYRYVIIHMKELTYVIWVIWWTFLSNVHFQIRTELQWWPPFAIVHVWTLTWHTLTSRLHDVWTLTWHTLTSRLHDGDCEAFLVKQLVRMSIWEFSFKTVR